MDYFRRFFGFYDQQPPRREAPDTPFPEDHNRYFDFEDNESPSRQSPDEHHGDHFHIFSDPLEMHRYFEQQMDSFLKHFGMPSFGNFFHSIERPDLHGQNEREESFQHPREQFIKKKFEKPTYELDLGQKADGDLDGKLSITDLDALLHNPSHYRRENGIVNKHTAAPLPFGRAFFNQSVQVKSIRNPDGSCESLRTITDSEGNQETTITKKVGDKEYTVLKKRDKGGKEEIHETMINMTEDDKALFQKVAPIKPVFDESLFNKFFK